MAGALPPKVLQSQEVNRVMPALSDYGVSARKTKVLVGANYLSFFYEKKNKTPKIGVR